MSLGRVFQKVEAATGNERRPTVDRRYGGTSSCCVNDDRNRRRPGRFDTYSGLNCATCLQVPLVSRSTQPCIPPGSLNRVPASAGIRAGMSALPGGR